MRKVHEGDEDLRLLDASQILELVPVSRTTLWRWVESGEFPRPLKVGGTNLWQNVEVRSWLRKLTRNKDDII